MSATTLHKWKRPHRFSSENRQGEKNTRRVILLTVLTMVVEILAGFAFGSMALLADGWHMSTHAIALGITAFAYSFARRHADNPRFSFGIGKVGVLGGYTSAITLALIALLMAAESLSRLFNPISIRFNEAIAIAFLGLIVNIVSAFLLTRSSADSSDDQHLHHEDQNLKAAYLHVLADALTSVLAIIALTAGKGFGWIWLDPIMGIVGAVIISRWSYGLLRDTSKILLDRDVNENMIAQICNAIEAESDARVSEIHVWRISSHQLAVIVSLSTSAPRPPAHYKMLLAPFEHLVHVNIEVNPRSDTR